MLKILLALSVRALEFVLDTDKLRARRFDIGARWLYMDTQRSDLRFSFIYNYFYRHNDYLPVGQNFFLLIFL